MRAASAAALAWLLLRETVTLRTWIAAALALCGVLVMVFDGLTLGDATGIFLALGTAMSMAGYAVSVRLGRNVDMTPAIALSGILAMFGWHVNRRSNTHIALIEQIKGTCQSSL